MEGADKDNKEWFQVETTDETLFEKICNTVFSLWVMNSRMQFTVHDLCYYFARCLAINVLAEWHKVMQL